MTPKPLIFLAGVLLGALLAVAGFAIGATVAVNNPTTAGSAGVTMFPDGAQAITPSDADVFARPVSVYVGTTGNVNVVPANGATAVTFVGVPAGSMLPVRVVEVNSTSTTASNLVAVF